MEVFKVYMALTDLDIAYNVTGKDIYLKLLHSNKKLPIQKLTRDT